MEILLGILVAFLIFVVVTITAVVLIARALVRKVRRNRALASTALRTRAGFSRGPQRKVRFLRVRLADTLDSGQAAVDLAAGSDGPRGELPRLFRRIREEAGALDLQLRLLESETDSAVLAEELPAADGRVGQVAGLVRRLRSAVASDLAGSTDDSLSTLHADMEREVVALRAGVQELHRLNQRDDRVRSSELRETHS
ncbi:hypothetical protein [Agromyces subbeticus]|uniref:hypothetical protein n=1 Tax=Agromyces subbeticus TaxID=293890 RepID=UPI0003B3C081|nr:hypothetical protein [Agromyces subbeticus]